MLLDTHVVLWLLDNSPRLGEQTRRMLTSGASLHVSAASVWELAVKAGLGKLSVPDELPELLDDAGLVPMPVTAAHAWSVREAELPQRDPFDRLLVTQARHEGLTFVTADAALLEAGPAAGCQVHDARR